jgi:hypothetical protein
LLQLGTTDGDGKTHERRPDHLLVIAPDNAQVAELTRLLPASTWALDRDEGEPAGFDDVISEYRLDKVQ